MSWEDEARSISTAMKLKQSSLGTIYYGEVHSFPIQVIYFQGQQHTIQFFMHFVPEDQAEQFKKELIDFFSKKELKFEQKKLAIEDGKLVYTFEKKLVGNLSAVQKTEILNQILEVANQLGLKPPSECEKCKSAKSKSLLINGVISQICDDCVVELEEKHHSDSRKYINMQVNYPLAFLTGLVTCLVGAFLWSALIIWTNKMYAMIAILNGIIVGFSMLYMAGKNTRPVLVGITVFTLLSVLIGNIFYYGYLMHAEAEAQSGIVDWMEFLKVLPEIMIENYDDTLFAGIFGIVGGLGATARWNRFSAPELVLEKFSESNS